MKDLRLLVLLVLASIAFANTSIAAEKCTCNNLPGNYPGVALVKYDVDNNYSFLGRWFGGDDLSLMTEARSKCEAEYKGQIAKDVCLASSADSNPASSRSASVFSCANTLADEFRPAGIVFKRFDVFPTSASSEKAFVSIETYLNVDSEDNVQARTHLVELKITEKSDEELSLESEDGQYKLSISCSSRCSYAGSSWVGNLTYPTSWYDELNWPLQTAQTGCKRMGWFSN